MSGNGEIMFAVGWTRTMTGEKGFVGCVTGDNFRPVSAIEQAERLPKKRAEEVAALVAQYLFTETYLVPVP